MARFEKNAAGEDVRVDSPEYGCFTVEAEKPAKPKPVSKTAAADEGEE